MNSKKVPCEQCLLIPSCRHKKYSRLFEECSLLSNCIFGHTIVGRKRCKPLFKLQEILKPTKWIFENRPDDHRLPWVYETYDNTL